MTRDDSGQQTPKGKEREGEDESISTSLLKKRMHKSMRNGMGCFKSKRKRQKGLNGENINESLLKIVRRLLGNEDRLLELSWDWKPCNSS